MKYKLFYGLFGCSNGVLYTPSCRQSFKLPKQLAYRLHTFINKFAYTGMEGTKLLFENKGE